jgi:type IV pilus assembly protein PilW
MAAYAPTRCALRRAEKGVGLIELMVAMVIGLFLIFGAVRIFQQSQTAFKTSESVARLQEVGRLALAVVEADLRMAGYWGLNNRAEYIINRAGPGAGLPSNFTSTQGTSINSCGGANSNWAINLDQYVVASNGTYPYTTNCTVPTDAGAYQAGTDVLTVRRAASSAPATLDADRIYIQTSRIQGTMFVPSSGCTAPTNPACVPAAYSPPASQSRELIVHAYYVATQSTMRTDVPSLRRKSFTNVNAPANSIVDEEVVPGVEDLQIMFGVDTDGDSNIDDYVTPLSSIPAGTTVVSAQVWMRIRAEDPEQGFKDTKIYTYPGAPTTAPNDKYRRIVISKTIQLRNQRI